MATQRAAAGILRSHAQQHWPDKWPSDRYRVINCLWCRGANVEVVQSAQHGRAHYKGLQTCGSVWQCPMCGSKVEERRRVQVDGVFTWANEQGLDSSLHTNTFPHGLGDHLCRLLDELAEALKHYRQHRTYKRIHKEIGFVGMVRALEVMFGDVNGWHPHPHELKFHRECLNEDDVASIRDELAEVWMVSSERAGLYVPDSVEKDEAFYRHGLNIRPHFTSSDYMQKTDQEKHWTPAHELAKASTKAGRRSGIHPFQLATRGHPNDAARFVEYVDAMKGRRKLLFSPGLLKKAGVQDMSDEAMAELEDDAARKIADITRAWDFIKSKDRSHNSRARVLDAAEQGGKDGIDCLLQEMGFVPQED